MEYKHTQWGFIAIFVLPMVAVAVVPLVAADDETTTLVIVATVAFMIALLAVVLVFSRLEVTVSGGRIVTAFGFGRPRTVVELGDVTAVRQMRNTWVQGWGSRKISRGWMYNVWGLDAVEIDLSSGKVFRIGTNDPENLLAVIALQIVR